MKKRSDDIVYFTFIDFLLQALFFGFMIYMLGQAAEAKRSNERLASAQAAELNGKRLGDLAKRSGFSNLTEFLEYLTKLAPVTDFRGMADFLARSGGIEKAKVAVNAVQKAGGIDKFNQDIERLRKLDEGTGKPPCLFDRTGDKKTVIPLATVVADDTTIRFEASNPALEEALALIGQDFKSIQSLSLAEFTRSFASLRLKRADCRYTLRFLESTRFVDARDAAGQTFYLSVGKR